MYTEFKKTVDLGDGKIIEISTGKYAKQADGSIMLKQGNTVLLATVVSSKKQKEGLDFLPMSCEYREKYAAAGRFPGGFLKREARPSDYEILISRLIDRALRPMFHDDYHAETFVNVFMMSADNNIKPDALAGFAASAALAVSDIPFNGPISEVRVARINGEFVVNPFIDELEGADMDMIIAGTIDNIVMVEGEFDEVSEEDMANAIKFGHDAIKLQCKAQLELAEAAGKMGKREIPEAPADEELRAKIEKETYQKVYDTAKQGLADKHKRAENFEAIKEEFCSQFSEEELEEKQEFIDIYYHDVEKKAIRKVVLDERIRLDGRKTNEIRPIWGEVDVLPAAHGSATFTRGETQSLTTVTLGTKLDEKLIDEPMINRKDRFLLHYNFLPFSTGDAYPYRGVGRREIGHGNLALRALKGIVPSDSPHVIRIVSEILESNGSSSMATVCAGTMAMMDAGIKIKRPVSGIAMGMISDAETGKYAILSDILGDEDHLGDMDFKVTGTEKGITATQMDIKVEGLAYEVLVEALMQAKEGRAHILGKMLEVIPTTNENLKPHAPKLIRMEIDKSFIGAVIGPGGKIIQEMQAETDTVITIEEVGNKGMVEISGVDQAKIDDAIGRIKAIAFSPEVGQVFDGKVKTITDYGAFVEIAPRFEALLHISEIEHHRLKSVKDVLSEGDTVQVKVVGFEKNGKIRLSRKVLLPKPEQNENK